MFRWYVGFHEGNCEHVKVIFQSSLSNRFFSYQLPNGKEDKQIEELPRSQHRRNVVYLELGLPTSGTVS